MIYSKLNLEQIIRAKELKNQQEHDAKEGESLGNLRGGNAGCLVDGHPIGCCPRKAMLRALGINKKPELINQMYFHQGIAMEDKLFELLGDFNGEVLSEPDSVYTLDTGRLITGRPDFLLTNSEGSTGIEFKTVCSTSTGERIFLDRKPKTDHLCQAGIYMLMRNAPWILLYWNSNSLDPRVWTLYKDKYKVIKNGKKSMDYKLKVQPFRIPFYLRFDSKGVLCFNLEGVETKTKITKQGILDYYNVVDEMLSTQNIGLKIKSAEYDGVSLKYDLCNYCEFKEACEETTNYEDFISCCKYLVEK